MASFKELSLSRPLPHSNTQRHHSHSISLGAVNPNHRISRRKSVTTTATATNVVAAAVAASVKDPSSGDSVAVAASPMPANRRGSGRKPLESSSVGAPSFLSQSMNNVVSHPHDPSSVAGNLSTVPSALDGAPNTTTTTTNNPTDPNGFKNRNRRASEGSPLVKGEGKRSMAELRCDRCGKGYKHGSCLSKHMWEHNPAWAITSKLLISKHQQVQLLEAASVLVNMNHDGPDAESELSSASPDEASERPDGLSSADTTPPPMGQDDDDDIDDMDGIDGIEAETAAPVPAPAAAAAAATEDDADLDEEDEDDEDDLEMSGVSTVGDKRYDVPSTNTPSNINSLFSQSYQSVPSSSFTESGPLHSPSFSTFRHSSLDTRPSTANTKLHDDDEADLAAAIGLCNFGTPRTRPTPLSPSIPPVPPLPNRHLDAAGQQSQSLDQSQGPADTAFPGSIPNMFLSVSYNPALSYKVSDEREVRRTSRQNRNADVDFGNRSAPPDDDDDGVFGRMEE